MKEQLLKQGFTEFDCGELGIHSLDEKTHIYLIPGKHWSLEVYISAGGASILTAAIPVSNIYEIETICNNNGIEFRPTKNIQSLKQIIKISDTHL